MVSGRHTGHGRVLHDRGESEAAGGAERRDDGDHSGHAGSSLLIAALAISIPAYSGAAVRLRRNRMRSSRMAA